MAHSRSTTLIFLLLVALASVSDAGEPATRPTPFDLTFHRKSVRRFIFSNNIPLARLVPSEVVALDLMHPSQGQPAADYALNDGFLEITSPNRNADSAIYVGGVTPFAAYRIVVQAIFAPAPVEIAFEFATLDRKNGVVVAVKCPADRDSASLRVLREGKTVREVPLYAGPAPKPPYALTLQLAGGTVALFATKDGRTTYLGHVLDDRHFADLLDFRDRKVAADSTFNVATRLPAGGRLVLQGAESFLSAGVGQADIRLITHKDGAPFIEDNRLWFTFSCRGLGISSSCQGVLSLDPSVFDPRLEGVILYDREDGLLRNDYSSHLFYDDDAREWRAFNCFFSIGGRGPSGMGVASSKKDPRRGLSIMKERVFIGIDGQHEDPCIIYDANAHKWRLLTTRLQGMRAMMFEADAWDGPYTRLAGPVDRNSTGTLIQKIGDHRYVFSGSSDNAVYVYSYPDLKPLGHLKMDLPPFTKTSGGRVWPNVFPLPPGFPSRYMAMMMDRPNFPGVKGSNWSYGALYLYEAWTPDISNDEYEFPWPRMVK